MQHSNTASDFDLPKNIQIYSAVSKLSIALKQDEAYKRENHHALNFNEFIYHVLNHMLETFKYKTYWLSVSTVTIKNLLQSLFITITVS
jgi:hypothetical protein